MNNSSMNIPTLYIETKTKPSCKELCSQIFLAIDHRLGTDYAGTYGCRATHEMVSVVGDLVGIHAVKSIVLDELREPALAKSCGEKTILSFLVHLAHALNVQLIIIPLASKGCHRGIR
jgi:hypothetical protein